LPNYEGPCSKLHGHRWTLHVTISEPVKILTGMVMDFKKLEEAVKEGLINQLDHNFLNAIIDNPTCENLLIYIADTLSGYQATSEWCQLELEESPGSSCLLKRKEYEKILSSRN
jgi:6-pyruvoyltetrahydropterin/6-carboxytetrahydropterin synthase